MVYGHISAGYIAGTFCYKTRRYLDVPVDSNAWQIDRGFVQGMMTASPTLLTYRETIMKGPLLHSIAKLTYQVLRLQLSAKRFIHEVHMDIIG